MGGQYGILKESATSITGLENPLYIVYSSNVLSANRVVCNFDE